MKKEFTTSAIIALLVMWMFDLFTGWGTISLSPLRFQVKFMIYREIVILAEIFWLIFSPYRKDCWNNSWAQLCFILTPVFLGGIFLLAGKHFFLAFVIFSFLFGVWIYQKICIYHMSRNQAFCKDRIRKKTGMHHRFMVLLIGAICALPSFFAYTLYPKAPMEKELIEDRINQIGEEAVRIGTEEESDPYEDNRDLLMQLNQENWKNLTAEERLALARDFAVFECQIMGIPSISINAKNMSIMTLGTFSDETKELNINVDSFVSFDSDIYECMHTICHEIYHWGQHYVISNIDWEQPLGDSMFFDEFRGWKENTEHYKSGLDGDYDGYASQPLERSAEDYADQEMEKIGDYLEKWAPLS